MNRRHSKNHPAVMYARKQRRTERIVRIEECLGLAFLLFAFPVCGWMIQHDAPGDVTLPTFAAFMVAALALLMGRAE